MSNGDGRIPATGHADLTAAVGRFYRGRKVVLLGRDVPQYRLRVQALAAMGAQEPFIVGNGIGLGDIPDKVAGYCTTDLGTLSFTDTARATDHLLAAPPRHVVAALHAYDPDGSALVLAESNVTRNTMAGRQVADGRPAEWAVLEDKLTVDRIWDDLGVTRLPYEVVAATRNDLKAVHRRLDLGQGTIWYRDMNGGVQVTFEQARWVRDDEGFEEAVTAVAAECERVKVTPFLPGTPCGINGFVLSDGVVVLRPFEELVLEGPERSQLVYAGCSTYFDPAPEVRDEIRDLARRVGAWMHRETGFRGAFSIGGVQTAKGFIPLDLLARGNTAHRVMSTTTPGLPWGLLQGAVAGGHDLGMPAAQVERILLTAVEHQRGAAVALHSTAPCSIPGRSRWLTMDGNRLRLSHKNEHSDACLVQDTLDTGSIVIMVAGPTLLGRDRRLAGRAADGFALSEALWNTGLEGLRPMPVSG
ncbi:hypothetical protein DY218_28770 [Streptomyces triticagri]|uniref:Uncharacterized protein n=1 Tax=Streptomyces triticagri TaxID=2293568 RepID=A0A372LX61_9ACTN|nr:hypothetical protein [Streptomyces triticagri]RFU83258.1 hypothetical protein DY218_28770 [Streptomyces triticagri]